MAQWADASTTNNIQPTSLDVNLTDFDPNYDLTYNLEAKCPMCRTQTSASPDNSLARQLKFRYPTTYAQRQADEELDRGVRTGQDGVEGVMILIGNKHRRIRGDEDGCPHEWTFFIRSSRPELVDHVMVDLHPTFRPRVLRLTDPPYEVRRRGWGWFIIEAEIVLKAPYTWVVDNAGTRQPGLELTWTLDFDGRGRQGQVRARVRKMGMESEESRPRQSVTAGHSLANGPDLADEDEEEDDDYESNDDDETWSSDEDEDDALSDETGTPRR